MSPDTPAIEASAQEEPGGSEAAPRQEATLRGKITLIRGHVHGALLVRRLSLRHRRFVRDARPLALHLEQEVFPELRRSRVERLELRPQMPHSEGAALVGVGGSHEVRFARTGHLANALERLGVSGVVLDTQLESGQIVEALLMFLWAFPHLEHVERRDDAYSGWFAPHIAAAMLGREGYHKFCAVMRFDVKARRYEVAYSYCELFFSRAVRSYVEHRPRFSDHRALFRASPRWAVAALVVFCLPAVLFLWSPYAAAVATVILGIVAALLTGLGVYTLGSVQYTREHHDQLIREHLDEVRQLSRFSEANPNPVIKVNADGEVVYANPATQALARRAGLDAAEVGRVLPEDFGELVAQCLRDAADTRQTETRRFGRHLHFTLTAFQDEQAVIAAGTDVTYLRQIEEKLRLLNRDLERLVDERTRELRETQDVTILTLAGLAETRDPETGQHLQRTRLYVKALAEELRSHPGFAQFLDDEVIDNLYKSTPLHDIGKVGVPDAILRKPGPLDEREREEMKRHVVYGGDTLRLAEERLGFDSFLGIARDIAYYHHEWWDGTGYPFGLKGEDIPWSARLMALADVYDALTSARYYKPAFPHERAREMIVAERGAHYDPAVIDAFLACEAEFIAIAEQYRDVVDNVRD